MAEFVGTYKFEKDDGKFDDLLKVMSKYPVPCTIVYAYQQVSDRQKVNSYYLIIEIKHSRLSRCKLRYA